MTSSHPSPAHTAGPWRTDWLSDERGWILDEQSNYLAEIVTKDDEGFVVPLDQQRANARLIAAAPELLEHLQNVLDEYQEHADDMYAQSESVSLARAAIAKAAGQD